MFERFEAAAAYARDHGHLPTFDIDGDPSPRAFYRPPAASADAVGRLEQDLGLALPSSYRDFLLVNDGAALFYDVTYGQYGVLVHGTAAYRYGVRSGLVAADLAALARTDIGRDLGAYLPFASLVGDSDLLLFDTAHPVREGGRLEYPVCYIDAIGRVDEVEVIDTDFGSWLDHMVEANGARWWHWCIYAAYLRNKLTL
jgi:hypothetical protein